VILFFVLFCLRMKKHITMTTEDVSDNIWILQGTIYHYNNHHHLKVTYRILQMMTIR